MTERTLAEEALERKGNREKWEFLRLEVRRLVEGSEELGALAAALLAGDEDFVAFEGGGRGGRIDDVLAELRRHATTHEVAEKCVGYVEGNRHRMNYPKFRAMGLLVGSGMVESACGTLVGERLKCNGMRWSIAGANDIMALRCCIRNKRYDHFWRHRKKHAA